MHPRDFLRTIYLGDRACRNILIDGWNERFVLEVDLISRVRSASGAWEFYSDEDINCGRLVFSKLTEIRFTPEGFVPNDSINGIEVEEVGGCLIFHIYIDSVDNSANHTEVHIEVNAAGLHLEDPSHPGVAIIS
jgi:hypothetical protein